MKIPYDGDCCSLTCIWTEDSVKEIQNLLNSRDYYVNIDGKMTFSLKDDIINLMLASFTS